MKDVGGQAFMVTGRELAVGSSETAVGGWRLWNFRWAVAVRGPRCPALGNAPKGRVSVESELLGMARNSEKIMW